MKTAWRALYVIVGGALLIYAVLSWGLLAMLYSLVLIVLGVLLVFMGIAGRSRRT